MNVGAIDPTASALAAQSASVANPPAKKAPPTAAPTAAPAAHQVSVAALSTPAATATMTAIPATVKPEDRALYAQILKLLGGNVNAALAALAAKEAAEGEG